MENSKRHTKSKTIVTAEIEAAFDSGYLSKYIKATPSAIKLKAIMRLSVHNKIFLPNFAKSGIDKKVEAIFTKPTVAVPTLPEKPTFVNIVLE